MGDLSGSPAVDLHDLSVGLARDVVARVIGVIPELAAGDVVFVTGRGKRSGGVSPLRQAVAADCAEAARERGWRSAPDGPGRVRVVFAPDRAAKPLGALFWIVVGLAVAAVAGVCAGFG